VRRALCIDVGTTTMGWAIADDPAALLFFRLPRPYPTPAAELDCLDCCGAGTGKSTVIGPLLCRGCSWESTVSPPDIAKKHGHVFFGRGKAETKFRAIEAVLKEAIEVTGCTEVVYERPGQLKGHAGPAMWGFIAFLQACCRDAKVNYSEVSPSTIKKQIGGHGKASKAIVRMQASAARGVAMRTVQEDEGDAMAISVYVERRWACVPDI
jgi:Holliday junction resolvasome RuvABC endonuclease subunit